MGIIYTIVDWILNLLMIQHCSCSYTTCCFKDLVCVVRNHRLGGSRCLGRQPLLLIARL